MVKHKKRMQREKKRFERRLKISTHGDVNLLTFTLTEKNAHRLRVGLYDKLMHMPGLGFLKRSRITPDLALNLVITKGLNAIQTEIDELMKGLMEPIPHPHILRRRRRHHRRNKAKAGKK